MKIHVKVEIYFSEKRPCSVSRPYRLDSTSLMIHGRNPRKRPSHNTPARHPPSVLLVWVLTPPPQNDVVYKPHIPRYPQISCATLSSTCATPVKQKHAHNLGTQPQRFMSSSILCRARILSCTSSALAVSKTITLSSSSKIF